MSTESMNGYAHPSPSGGHVPQPTPAPEKGLLDDAAIRANAELMAAHVISQFDKATSAALTHSHWMTLRGIVIANMMSIIKGTQDHLAGCNMVWQAMLAPGDRVPLLEAVDAEITRLHSDGGVAVDDGDKVTALNSIREKLIIGASASMPVPT